MATTKRADPGWGRTWPPEEEILADALAGQPVIVAMLARFPRATKGSLRELCSRLVGLHTELVIDCLDDVSARILGLAVLNGILFREELLAEAAGVDEAVLDAAVRGLAALGLVEVRDGHLLVSPPVAELTTHPFPAFMKSLDNVTSDRLGLACRLIGIEAGTRKFERAEAIRSVLRDPERLLVAVSDAGPEAAKVFARILEASMQASDEGVGVSGYGIGSIGQWELGLPSASLHRGYSTTLHDVRRGPPRSPFEELTARCLVGSDGMGRITWAWFDCVVALHGAVFSSWSVHPADIREIDEPIGVATRVLAAAEVLVEQVGLDAHEGKKTGDRHPPLKAVKTSATIAGVDPGLAVVLVEAAINIGLLMAVERPRRGRGRNTEHPVAWVLNDARLSEWRARPPEERWLSIVSAWLEGNDAYTAAGMRAWARRLCAVSSLASLDAGRGVAAGSFADWIGWRHELCAADMDDVVADLVRLGACSGGSVIGLGRAGRAALGVQALADANGHPGASDELAACFAGGEDTFVVQPDHTIVSAADLVPEVIAMLSLIADQESGGAAVVWRLSASRLARAARVHAADEIVGFLRRHSSVPVSDNVERFVRDHVVAVDALSISAAGCYIVVTDPARLTTAVSVKAAKLTLLAPTIAVSSLEPTRVRDLLAAKGLHVETGSADDTAGGGRAKVTAAHPPDWLLAQRPPDQPLSPAEALPVGPDVVWDLATRIVES